MFKKPKTFFTDKESQTKQETILCILLIYVFSYNDRQLTKYSSFVDTLSQRDYILRMSRHEIKTTVKELLSTPYKSSIYSIKNNTIYLSPEFGFTDFLNLFKQLYNILGERFINFVKSFDYKITPFNWEFILSIAIKDEKLAIESLERCRKIYFWEVYTKILLYCEDLSFIKDSKLKKTLSDIINIFFKSLSEYTKIEATVDLAKNIVKLTKYDFKIKEKFVNDICLPLFVFLKKDILEYLGKSLPDDYNPKYLAKGLACILDNNEKKAAENFAIFVSEIKEAYFKSQFQWFSVLGILIPIILYRNRYLEQFNLLRQIIISLTKKLTSAKLLKELIFDKKVISFDPLYKRNLKLNELSIAYYADNYLGDKYYAYITGYFRYETIPYLEKEIVTKKKKKKPQYISVLYLLETTKFSDTSLFDAEVILSTLKKKLKSNAELIFGIEEGNLYPYKKEKLKSGKFKITKLSYGSLKDNKYKWLTSDDKIFSSFCTYWDFDYNILEYLVDSDKFYFIKSKNEFLKSELKKIRSFGICNINENKLIMDRRLLSDYFVDYINDTFWIYTKGSDLLKSISEYLKKYKDNFNEIKTSSIDELFEIMSYLCEDINFIIDLLPNDKLIKKIKFDKIIDYENDIFVYAGITGKKYSIDFLCLPFEDFNYFTHIGFKYFYIKKGEEKILINFYNKKYLKILTPLVETFPSISEIDRLEFDTFEQLLKALAVLNNMKGIKVNISEGLMVKNSYKVSENNVNIDLKESGDYFEIDGTLDLGNNKYLEFKKLLDKIFNNIGNFVKIKKGEYVELNQELLEKLKNLATISFQSNNKLKVNKKIYNIFNSEEFKKKIDDVFKETYNVPTSFKGVLRDYQFEGYNWLVKMYKLGLGACLGDDMGLGKTVQAIVFMEKVKNDKPFLIVVPASLIFNWEREIKKFSDILKPIIYFQNRDIDFKKLTGEHVPIISYGLLVNDIKKIKGAEFNVAVYDEAQLIKNFNTVRSDAAKAVKAKFKMITTGTPVENNLLELWNLMELINPGVLGTVEQFKKRFLNCNNNKLQMLKNAVKTFILRRNKKDVLKELPEKTEIVIDYNLSDEERTFYNALKSSAIEKLAKLSEQEVSKNAMTILSEIIRLKQACCYPGLIDESIKIKETSKISILFQLIEELIDSGHRALIFSQFVQFLKIIEKELKKRNITYSFISGSVPITKRKKIIDKFQKDDDIKLFLLSLKTGGLGLNLTAADIVIHLDPWWNPAVENQASDRIYRIGQKKTVVIYKLISKGTIEEKILTLQNKKKELADFILSETDKVEKVNVKDLLELLK